MVITYAYLQGEQEAPDETIRHFVSNNWDILQTSGIKPLFRSPEGVNDLEADHNKRISANIWNGAKNKNYIRFKHTDTVSIDPDSWNNDRSSLNMIVTIDIFAETTHLMQLFSQEVENILFALLVNNTNRIKKSNGIQDSFIARFDRQSIDWIQIGEFEDVGVTEQFSGEIGAIVEKSRI